MKFICRKSLRLFHYGLLQSQRALLRHPRKIFILALVLFATCLVSATKLQIGIRAEDWLDQSLASTKLYLEMKETFGSEDKLSWIVSSPWNYKNFCEQQRRHFNWANEENRLQKISSIFELRRPLYNSENETLIYPRELEENCQFSEAAIQNLQHHPLTDSFSIQPGKDLLFKFTFEELETPTKWGKTDFQEVEKWIAHLKQLEPTSLFGGSLFFQESTKEGILWASKLNILTALVIAICCRLFLGTWLSGAILVCLIVFTTSVLQTGMTLKGNIADPLSSSIFVIMTIAIVEDFFFSFFFSRAQKVRLRTALRRMSLPSFFTSLTTAIGLGSLVTSTNMSVQNLGFWTGVGAMVEWALVYLLLPSVCKVFPRLDELAWKGNIFLPNWFRSIGSFSPSRKLVIALTLPLVLIFFTYDKVNINYTPFDMFPSSHPLLQFRDYVKGQRGFEGDVSLIFNHENLTEEDSKLIAEVAKHALVVSYKDPRKMTEELMPAEADPALKRMIESEIKETTSLKDFQQNGKSRAILFIKEYDMQSLDALTQYADKVCAGRCYLSGEIVAFKDYALSMLKTLYSSFILSLATVSLLLALLSIAVSGRVFWPLILSSVWAPLMLMIFVSVFQIKINVVTCLALDLMIGLSGDNAVQFLLFDRKGRWKKGHTELLPVGLMIVSTIALISLILLLSYFRTARILSGLMEFGALLMLIGDLWILNYFTEVKESDSESREHEASHNISNVVLAGEHDGSSNS